MNGASSESEFPEALLAEGRLRDRIERRAKTAVENECHFLRQEVQFLFYEYARARFGNSSVNVLGFARQARQDALRRLNALVAQGNRRGEDDHGAISRELRLAHAAQIVAAAAEYEVLQLMPGTEPLPPNDPSGRPAA